MSLNRSNLHEYQETTVSHIIDNTHCGAFLDMGLGKTISSLTAAEYLIYQDLEITKALVIAPKRVVDSVWMQEAKKWEHTKHLKIVKVIGTPKKREAILKTKADIYLLGRDNVAWICGLYGGSMLPFDMLIIDESSSFKNPQSLRFKALKKTQPSFKRVVILTGTPAPNGLIDLWSQIYLLDRGERFNKYITNFRKTYFTNVSNNSQYAKYHPTKLGAREIHRKIADICISMKAEDYLNLPETIYNDIEITFPPRIQSLYNEFEKEQVLDMFGDGQEITAVNSAALRNKLLQFANGAVYDEDRNYHVVHDEKIEATKELIEAANGKPVLIGWTYRHDMYRLKEALKEYEPRELKTDHDVLDWNAGKIKILMMHPASGGHGLNLQDGGNNLIWFGQTDSLELYEQLNARLNRQGQKSVVVVSKIIALNTMDIDVVRSQARKGRTQDDLMEGVKVRIKKYLQKN